MNNVLDKFGIYDLIAVLLSGISICTFSLLVLHFVYQVEIDIDVQVNETLAFLIISYFVGLLFQELGSLIQKIRYKDNSLLKKALKVSDESNVLLTAIEKDSVYDYVKSKLHLKKTNDNVVYNYCKFYIMTNCDTTRIDRDQSLSAMSRSLSLYFLVLAIIAAVTAVADPDLYKITLILVSGLFSILLYLRCIRFAMFRYTCILRTFYYNVVVK